MTIRTRIRRWWIGADRQDFARASIAALEQAERAGQEKAWAFVRQLHAEHPNPNRRCSVPDCCRGGE